MQRNTYLKTFNPPIFHLENINLKSYETGQNSDKKKVTTVVGIKSANGIVLASDSQGTSDNDGMKALDISKIFRLNKFMGVGASGDVGHMKVLVEELEERLEQSKFKTELDLRQTLDNILCELFREYNVERSKRLGYSETVLLFTPAAILGAKLEDDTFVLYRLRLPPWVDAIEASESIGSGELYAKLLIRQQSRSVPAGLSQIDLDYNIWISMLTINEIKTFDSKTGGSTQVAIIDKNGFRQLKRDEIVTLYDKFRQTIASGFSEKLGIPKERALALYPDP